MINLRRHYFEVNDFKTLPKLCMAHDVTCQIECKSISDDPETADFQVNFRNPSIESSIVVLTLKADVGEEQDECCQGKSVGPGMGLVAEP
jgi:hypothetical protein